MVEVIKVIVLACQIHTGVNQNFINEVYNKQRECQRKLVQCIDKKDLVYFDVQLKDCLKKEL